MDEEMEQSINEMLVGQGKPIEVSPVAAVRMQSGLSQNLQSSPGNTAGLADSID